MLLLPVCVFICCLSVVVLQKALWQTPHFFSPFLVEGWRKVHPGLHLQKAVGQAEKTSSRSFSTQNLPYQFLDLLESCNWYLQGGNFWICGGGPCFSAGSPGCWRCSRGRSRARSLVVFLAMLSSSSMPSASSSLLKPMSSGASESSGWASLCLEFRMSCMLSTIRSFSSSIGTIIEKHTNVCY